MLTDLLFYLEAPWVAHGEGRLIIKLSIYCLCLIAGCGYDMVTAEGQSHLGYARGTTAEVWKLERQIQNGGYIEVRSATNTCYLREIKYLFSTPPKIGADPEIGHQCYHLTFSPGGRFKTPGGRKQVPVSKLLVTSVTERVLSP
jgi:hypothetical protein